MIVQLEQDTTGSWLIQILALIAICWLVGYLVSRFRITVAPIEPPLTGVPEPEFGQDATGKITYFIGYEKGQPNITCNSCGRTSFHPKDIENRYCGFCHKFHSPGIG